MRAEMFRLYRINGLRKRERLIRRLIPVSLKTNGHAKARRDKHG